MEPDGIVGERTLQRLNSYPDQKGLFDKIKQTRRAYLNLICIDRPANKRFLKGWLNRLNDFRWIPMAILFCVMFSSCRTAKTETTKQTMVETLHATSLHGEQKNYVGEQNEKQLEDQAENRTTEIITAIFDTLDSKPILKTLRIERTVSDRAVHAERQAESRASGTEVQGERLKVQGERQMEVQIEKKTKPAGISVGWWIAGGSSDSVAAVIWRVEKIIGKVFFYFIKSTRPLISVNTARAIDGETSS